MAKTKITVTQIFVNNSPTPTVVSTTVDSIVVTTTNGSSLQPEPAEINIGVINR